MVVAFPLPYIKGSTRATQTFPLSTHISLLPQNKTKKSWYVDRYCFLRLPLRFLGSIGWNHQCHWQSHRSCYQRHNERHHGDSWGDNIGKLSFSCQLSVRFDSKRARHLPLSNRIRSSSLSGTSSSISYVAAAVPGEGQERLYDRGQA